MTTVITLPQSLDDHRHVEQVLDQLAPLSPEERIIVDARQTTWASPYGLTFLLSLAQSRLTKPDFHPPEAEDRASYWARVNFFRHAEELYNFLKRPPRARAGGDSGGLLEVTPVAQTEDVHEVVDRIQEKAGEVLVGELSLDKTVTMRFTMALSEACQNIVEHAGRGGWVAAQRYRWQARAGGRKVVMLAVCDVGIGIRASLESSPRRPITDGWNDAVAIESAVMNRLSRYPDPGRGQGFANIVKFVEKWDGRMSVRSGTARIVHPRPKWFPEQEDPPREEGLSPFPGTMIQIVIPERVT